MCRMSWNLGASTSWNPQGLSRPVMGLLYLFYHCLYIIVLIALKTVTRVAETCRRLLCNKITFINPSVFVVSFTNFIHLSNIRNVEHIKLIRNKSFPVQCKLVLPTEKAATSHFVYMTGESAYDSQVLERIVVWHSPPYLLASSQKIRFFDRIYKITFHEDPT